MLPCHILAYHLWTSLASSPVKAVKACSVLPCPALPCPALPFMPSCDRLCLPDLPSPYSAEPHLFSSYLPCPYLTFILSCLPPCPLPSLPYPLPQSLFCPLPRPCPGARPVLCPTPGPILALLPTQPALLCPVWPFAQFITSSSFVSSY